jgi:squalene-hopene/tetraprenyl-beta-curcumene cyclase
MAPAIDFTSIAMFDSPIIPLPLYSAQNLSNPIAAFIKANINGSQVITNSWGWSELDILGYRIVDPTWKDLEALFRVQIDIAIARGAVVVFAAGNGGPVGWPGSMPEVISVGGAYVAQNNSVTASNYASSGYSILYPFRHVPDISGIVGQKPYGIFIEMPTQPNSSLDVGHAGTNNAGTDTDGTTDNDGWAVVSGTSSAAPQVAGVVALIKQLKPSFNQFKILGILQETAYDVISGTSGSGDAAGPGKDNATGYGLVNAFQAVEKADPVTIATKRGLDFLRRTQSSDGSWSNNVGISGLATLAFLNDGYNENDSNVQKGVQYILSKVNSDGTISSDSFEVTYETSIAILVLKATHNSAYANKIATAKDWLVNSQWDNDSSWGSVNESHPYFGGFGYGHGERPDLSNTQFALLALNAADLSPNDEAWGKAVKFVTRCQNFNLAGGNDQWWAGNDGGFIYLPDSSLAGGTTSYGSMTGAGMWGLALGGVPTSDPRFKAALGWVDKYYTWNNNPTTGGSWGDNALYYYYLSMSKGLSMARKTRVGGLLGFIDTHDWYKELSDKLTSLQTFDGSWSNSNGGFYEGTQELATSYALLALQTRQLPKNADLELVIILHSPADIHLYNEYGSHVGKNYITGGIDTGIPGSSYSPNDPQTISIKPPEAGTYHFELIGVGDGPWQIEIIGYQDGVQVSYDSYTGSIQPGKILATDLNVGAFEGGITIFSSQPAAAAVMNVTPIGLNLTGDAGTTLNTGFTVTETGGSEVIQSISIFADDMTDGFGNMIPVSSVSFNPATFDLPASASQDILVSLSIPTDLPSGTYTGLINIESLNAGTKSIQLTVDVGSNQPQPPVLTIPSNQQTTQYSDSLSFNVSATDPDDPGNSLTFSATGLPNDLVLKDNGNGTATISGIANVAPDVYTAQITVKDPGGLSDTKSVTIVVNKEDARATYIGPLMISTSCATCSTATIPLRATIQDITEVLGDPAYDPDAGNITNATVSFVNRSNADAVLCTANVTLLDQVKPTVGAVTCNWSANIGSSYGADYTIGTIVNGYYTRNSTEDDVVVVVSKPTSNFITGGGYLINQTSGGTYAGDPGLKTNFGLNIKFTQKLTNLQGRVTIIIRQGGHVYQIKSTALNSLVAIPFGPSNPKSGTAELVGKATITDVTDPLLPITVAGNTTLNVVMKDNGERGSADLIGISLWSKDGKLLFSSNWDGKQTLKQLLNGGNLSIK